MADVKVVELPQADIADVPRGLRALADQIERGDFGGPAFQCAWVLDCGDYRVECGLLGRSPSSRAEGYYLMAAGMHNLLTQGPGRGIE